MKVTCEPIIKALNTIRKIEWGKFSSDFSINDPKSRPPLVIFRFEESNDDLAMRLNEYIKSFSGYKHWEIQRFGRNLLLSTVEFVKFIDKNRSNPVSFTSDEFAKSNYEYIKEAYLDVEALSNFILNFNQNENIQ